MRVTIWSRLIPTIAGRAFKRRCPRRFISNGAIKVKNFVVLVVGLLGVTAGYCVAGEADQKQMELDSKCEEARQIALAPLKQEVFKECLETKTDESLCKIEADEYDGARPNRGPMFYDLPECEKAFDYKKDN